MFRIKELRIKKNISMRQAAKDLGIPYTTYISYEKETHEPNSELLIKMADYFNCSIDYLIGRSNEIIDDSVLDKVAVLDNDILERYGNIYQAQIEQEKINSFRESVSGIEMEHIIKYRTLDEYSKKVVDSVLDLEYDRCSAPQVNEPNIIHLPKSIFKPSAGSGNWLDEQQLESVSVLDTPQARKANLILEVDGDSMSPMYESGDNVLVNTKANVAVGDIGIFIVDGSGYIKKLGTDRLISVNPEYDDIFPTEYSDFRCVGKVLGKAEILE